MLLGKKHRRILPNLVSTHFSPYLYFVRGFSALRRLKSRKAPYSEVSKGLYIGGWPSSPEKMPSGNPAVIDCTYTRSPDPGAMESSIRWALRKRTQNTPIFIHCAYGHGRSVALMCALLVGLGVVDDWKNGEKLIKEKQPYIRMSALHRKALEEWSMNRLSPQKNGSNARY
ncbi:unnamed protein product [Lactuca virosa]|uniref:Tyrosine specific protein phosphatases domain-containing protein n=1 Tax=Lactuca virosa TaxID=75947 RepID=A0AAU9PEU1_9ASTR|nr:unnamed protein product [Lactuca virosa]